MCVAYGEEFHDILKINYVQYLFVLFDFSLFYIEHQFKRKPLWKVNMELDESYGCIFQRKKKAQIQQLCLPLFSMQGYGYRNNWKIEISYTHWKSQIGYWTVTWKTDHNGLALIKVFGNKRC